MDKAFPTDPALTAITVAYRNGRYIADEVMPRVTVFDEKFKYWEYPVAESFLITDDKVGRKGRPNQVDLSGTELTDSTEDHGLDDPIPVADIKAAPAGRDPRDRAVVQISEYIAINREMRVAAIVEDAANYPVGNKITLSGTDQFSDFVNSDPLAVIQAGIDACLMTPNIMTLGQDVWSVVRRHPAIISSINHTSGDKGIAARAAVAELFELDGVLVGQSRKNTAKKGQAATVARIWGKHIQLQYRDLTADTNGGITWGFTAQYGTRVAGSDFDKNIGLRGGEMVRAGESVKEKVIASQAGYLITDAVP